MFNSVLVALSDAALDDASLEHALRMTWREDLAMTLLHVVEPSDDPEQPLRLRKQQAERRLAKRAEALRGAGLQVESLVAMGDPTLRVLAIAEELESSLICLATHGRTGPARWLKGSVTESVMRQAKVPVLITPLRAPARPLAQGYQKILVPVDGSVAAIGILDRVRAFAELYGSEVTLLRVGAQPTLNAPVDGNSLTCPTPGPSREQLEHSLEVLRGTLKDVPHRTEVRFADSPSGGILAAIEAGDYDLVALGTHGRTGLDRFVLGSTAEAVMRESKVPLLVWRTLTSRSVEPQQEPSATA